MDQKNKWLIKITCVIAAFGLWLYISNINDNQIKYEVKSIPVELINTDALAQSKMKILPGQQFTISVYVKGKPADIYKIKPQDFKVIADMGEYVVRKGENKIPVRITDHPENVLVLNSDTLVLKVELDDLIQKTFPVVVDFDVKAKDGYYVSSNYASKPTDVIVNGAAKYVNQVAKVVAKGTAKNVDADINLSVPFQALDASGKVVSDVDISPKLAEISVSVKKTKTVGINIKTKGNISKDMVLKTLTAAPDKVDIAGANIDGISSLDTEPIDLAALTPNKVVTAKIILPQGVTLLNSDQTVKIKATIDKIISKNLTYDIAVKNLNDTLTATIDNPKLSLTISGIEAQVNALKPEDITCSVDVNNLPEGEHNLNVNVTVPDGITKVSAAPQSVKVTLKKKTQ